MKGFYFCLFSLILTLLMGPPDFNDHSIGEMMQHTLRAILMRGMMPVSGPGMWRSY